MASEELNIPIAGKAISAVKSPPLQINKLLRTKKNNKMCFCYLKTKIAKLTAATKRGVDDQINPVKALIV